ncbi:MAG: hypothetical protein WBP02_05720, partial [Gammaproteobacteria bacterium]
LPAGALQAALGQAGPALRAPAQAVHGELIFKLLREAGIALGSESANGSYSIMIIQVFFQGTNALSIC